MNKLTVSEVIEFLESMIELGFDEVYDESLYHHLMEGGKIPKYLKSDLRERIAYWKNEVF